MSQKKSKYNTTKLNEYRIRYNAGEDHAFEDSYHYFQAEDAEQALAFHNAMMAKKNLSAQIIGVEEKNPYTSPPSWEDRTQEIKNTENE